MKHGQLGLQWDMVKACYEAWLVEIARGHCEGMLRGMVNWNSNKTLCRDV